MAKTTTVQMTWLELARRRAGHSRKEAAALAGLSVRSWEGWEQGAHAPSVLARSRLRILYADLIDVEIPALVRVNLETLKVVL